MASAAIVTLWEVTSQTPALSHHGPDGPPLSLQGLFQGQPFNTYGFQAHTWPNFPSEKAAMTPRIPLVIKQISSSFQYLCLNIERFSHDSSDLL